MPDLLSTYPSRPSARPQDSERCFENRKYVLSRVEGLVDGPDQSMLRDVVPLEALQLEVTRDEEGRSSGSGPEGIITPRYRGALQKVSQCRGGLPPRVLQRVRENIEASLGNPITLQDLAAIAGLSESHFSRAFKQSEGMTPHKYLMKCRLRQAVRLLSETDLPLSEIAIVTGFADQSHFSHQFRKYVGITPSSYRWSTR